MHKEIKLDIDQLTFYNLFANKSIRLCVPDPFGNYWSGDISYNSFDTIINDFKTFRSKNLSKISIENIMSTTNTSDSDFKFELKKKKNLSIIFKIYQKYNDINNADWRKVYKLKFLNFNFTEFDDFVENLSLLTKLK